MIIGTLYISQNTFLGNKIKWHTSGINFIFKVTNAVTGMDNMYIVHTYVYKIIMKNSKYVRLCEIIIGLRKLSSSS